MTPGASTPIHVGRTLRQTMIISAMIAMVIFAGTIFAYLTWKSLCGGSILTCFSSSQISPATYLFATLIRPFTLLPQSVLWLIHAHTFFHPEAAILPTFLYLTAATLLPFFPIYFVGRCLYSRLTKPWLLTHLPKNLKKCQRHALPLVLQTQMVGFFHKDFATLIYALMGLPIRKTLIGILFTELVKIGVFMGFCLTYPPIIALCLTYLTSFLLMMGYVTVKQLVSLASGGSYLRTCQSHWYEAFCEIQTNNIGETRSCFRGSGRPILLLYGFFASRRTLLVMEKQLQKQGHEVFSVNLGGLFDVFFTKSIPSSAQSLDLILKDVMRKNQLSEISIVAHSKGGLVAAWWLLRLGGHRHCHQLITLGSPFGGTYYTWIALITPLGLLWQDVWQMRPNSRLLKALQESYIPRDLKIYCLYSSIDRITRHKRGVLQAIYGHTENITSVPMHQFSHFQYLYKKGVMETIHQILSSP